MAITFAPVDDSRRTARGTRGKPSPLIDELLAGKTLLVQVEEGKTFSSGWTNRILNRHGMRARTTKAEDGIVLWAEPLPDKPAATVEAVVAEAPATTE